MFFPMNLFCWWFVLIWDPRTSLAWFSKGQLWATPVIKIATILTLKTSYEPLNLDTAGIISMYVKCISLVILLIQGQSQVRLRSKLTSSSKQFI